MTDAILPVSYGCVTSPASSPRSPFVVPERVLSKKTGMLIEELWNAGTEECSKEADRILDCATNVQGRRCSSPLCPGCAARAAKRMRRDLESTIALLPGDLRVVHLTIGTGADDLLDGRAAIMDGFRDLREHRAWRRHVIGGKGQIEWLPASGGSRRWNVHAHLVTWTRPGRAPVGAISSEWSRLMTDRDLPGSLDWRFIERRFVRGHSGEAFLASVLLRPEAAPERADGVSGMGALRGGARRSGAAMGGGVRGEAERLATSRTGKRNQR